MFDGNGNWTSDFSAQADRDNGIKILASRFDNIFIADIKESFENCLTKDGQIAPIGNFNMGGQKITNVANGTNDTDAVNKSQLDTKVDLTGTQTISGAKTFTGATTLPAGTTISKQDNNVEGGEITFQRANNDPLAQDPSIDLYNGLMRFLHCNGVQVPASDALTTAVSTTGISKAANGYVKFGNGIIIQWGRYRANNSALTTITFPIPFSGDSTYSVSTDIYGPDDSRERPFTVRAKTSSNITVYNYFGGGTNDCFIIAIGY